MIIDLIGEGFEKPLLRKSRKLKSLLCDKETESAINYVLKTKGKTGAFR